MCSIHGKRRPIRFGASVRLAADQTTKGENVMQKGYSVRGSTRRLEASALVRPAAMAGMRHVGLPRRARFPLWLPPDLADWPCGARPIWRANPLPCPEVVPLAVELRRRSMLDQAASSLVGVTAATVWSSAARSAGRCR